MLIILLLLREKYHYVTLIHIYVCVCVCVWIWLKICVVCKFPKIMESLAFPSGLRLGQDCTEDRLLPMWSAFPLYDSNVVSGKYKINITEQQCHHRSCQNKVEDNIEMLYRLWLRISPQSFFFMIGYDHKGIEDWI